MLWPAMGSPTPGSSSGSGTSRERPEMPDFFKHIFLMIFFRCPGISAALVGISGGYGRFLRSAS